MKLCITIFLASLFLTFALSAESNTLQVIYSEGKAEVRTGDTWREMLIGEVLDPQASIRLATGARLELATQSGTISIFRSGTFGIASLAQESRVIGNLGLKDLIGARLRKLGGDLRSGQTTSAGIRGAEIGTFSLQKSMSLAYNESMEKGLQALESGNLERAYDCFRDALDMGTNSLQVQAAVFTARSALGLGKAGQALDSLDGIEPAVDDPLRPQFFLVRAQSALNGLDYLQSSSDFTTVLQTKDIDSETRQEALLGLGLTLSANGDRQAATTVWKQALAINPKSETSKIISGLLNNP